MKSIIKAAVISTVMIGLFLPANKACAQDITGITGIISAGIKKVIKAFDLEVQRLQNKTIWLQNAQKELENTMQQLHLTEITGWVQKQKDLYAAYFDELWKVKTIISYYHRIKEITQRQVELVAAYKQAWSTIQQDKHFTGEELEHMQAVYTGIMNESLKNIDQLMLVIQSFTMQMSDAERLQIINHAGDDIERNYSNLVKFNNQNAMLSLQRAKDEEDIDLVKKMYGL
jgi:hypothetical protein